jgi:hypothetical protein
LPELNGGCGHGQVRRADEGLEDVEDDLGPSPEPAAPVWDCPLLPLRVTLWDLQAFLRANESSLINYGERYRRGERISTAVVESMVNRVIGRRMAKKQQMCWSRRGAHLPAQIRVAVLDGRLPGVFRSWYPEFRRSVLREDIAS